MPCHQLLRAAGAAEWREWSAEVQCRAESGQQQPHTEHNHPAEVNTATVSSQTRLQHSSPE